jgi:hypothetical protein
VDSLAAALRGSSSASVYIVAGLALALWLAAAAFRPDAPLTRAAVRMLARGTFTSALARYVRVRELRIQAFAAVAAAGAGAALLRAVQMPRSSAAAVAAATGVLGAAVFPLAAAGIDARADWLWRAAPRSRAVLACLFEAAALLAAAVVALVAVLAALAAAPVAPGRVLPLAAFAAVAFAAALVAGAVVPWRPRRPAEQLGTYAAFVLLGSMLAAALARLAVVVDAESGARAAALAVVVLAAALGSSALLAAR